jgi:hypothetical protein
LLSKSCIASNGYFPSQSISLSFSAYFNMAS